MHKVTVTFMVNDADDKEDVKCFTEEIFEDHLSNGDIEDLEIKDIVELDSDEDEDEEEDEDEDNDDKDED